MSSMKRALSLVALLAALVAAPALADDAEKKGVAKDLAEYFPIRAALAADKLDGVKDRALALAKSDDKDVAKAAEELSKAKEIEGARKTFGDLSKALIASVEAAMKKGEKLGAIYVFRCPMAKPYGKWLQEKNEIGNPYYGSSMLKCGKLEETKGEEPKK